MTKTAYQNVSHYQKVQDEVRGTNEKEWIMSPNGTLYLFKKTQIKEDGTSTNADYGELLYYQISSLLWHPCAVTKLARRNHQNGIISQYFLKDNEELIDYHLLIQAVRPDFDPKSLKCKKTKEYYSLDLILNATKYITKSSESYHKIRKQLIETCLIDALCGHYDRNPSNIALIKNYQQNKVERYQLSPTFDNGTSNAMSLPVIVAKEYLRNKDGLEQLHQKIISKIGLGDTRTVSYDDFITYIMEHYSMDANLMLERINDMITVNNLLSILDQSDYRNLDQYHKELAFKHLLDMKERLIKQKNSGLTSVKVKVKKQK